MYWMFFFLQSSNIFLSVDLTKEICTYITKNDDRKRRIDEKKPSVYAYERKSMMYRIQMVTSHRSKKNSLSTINESYRSSAFSVLFAHFFFSFRLSSMILFNFFLRCCDSVFICIAPTWNWLRISSVFLIIYWEQEKQEKRKNVCWFFWSKSYARRTKWQMNSSGRASFNRAQQAKRKCIFEAHVLHQL